MVRRVKVQEKDREAAFVAAETTVFVSQQQGGQGPPMSHKQRLEAPPCTDMCTQQWNKKVIVGLCKRRDKSTQGYCAHTPRHNGRWLVPFKTGWTHDWVSIACWN